MNRVVRLGVGGGVGWVGWVVRLGGGAGSCEYTDWVVWFGVVAGNMLWWVVGWSLEVLWCGRSVRCARGG